jgi:hypothetical protein
MSVAQPMYAGISSRQWDACHSWTRVTSALAREALTAAPATQARRRPERAPGAGQPPAGAVGFDTVVYFDNSMTPAQQELTCLSFRTEVDPPTREALGPACPLAYPDMPEG